MRRMLVLLVAVLMFITSWASAASPPLKRITVAESTEVRPSHAWALETDDAEHLSRTSVCETLVKIDVDGRLTPGLAESWQRTDQTTWQFKLRSGVKFQNGEPFNAQAVITALNHIRSVPTLPRGFTANTITSVNAAGDMAVVIRTGAPDTLLPNRLFSYNTCILAPSAYKAGAQPNPLGTGTGPFVLTQAAQDVLKLMKNKNYWGGPVTIDEATWLFVPDGVVRAGMVRTGEADIANNVPVSQVPLLEKDARVTVMRSPDPRTVTFYFNVSRRPFTDVRVRRAIQYAIDKKAIVNSILEGIGQPAVGPFAPTEKTWLNSRLKGYPYDPQRAKTLLAEAGYKPGDLKFALLTYPSRAELPPTAEAIQKMLKDVGIVADLQVKPLVDEDAVAGKFDTLLLSRGHLVDVYDPEGFLTADYSCKGTYNISQYCNPRVDAFLAQVRDARVPEARYNLYRQIQSVLVDDEAVSVFVYHPITIVAHDKKVLNYRQYPLTRYILTPTLDIAR
ncbi:MAG TPA: ABC transporter substrate-binding protein [bacterium]|nr:ABC transporter substrate-binding protein [bacterium]